MVLKELLTYLKYGLNNLKTSNMTQNRIQINGVWYVREDQAQEPIKLDPIDFEGVVVENEDFCFEATKHTNGNYNDIDIEFTDKRIKPWKVDHWDNNNWMRGILENNPDSLNDMVDIGSEGIRYFQAFLQHLKNKKWL